LAYRILPLRETLVSSSVVYRVPGRVPVTSRQACLPEYSGTGQNDTTDVLPAARYFSLFFFKRPKTKHHVYFFIYIYQCLSMNTITNEITSAETISGTTAPYVPSSILSATARRESSISSISSATRDTARTCSLWPEGDDTTTSSTWFLAPASSKKYLFMVY
jgi:hypothetical protein